MSFFLGTQERVRNSHGKRAISVRATEVLLYMARPGIEPRTSDLRVRCPTDCATLVKFIAKLCSNAFTVQPS